MEVQFLRRVYTYDYKQKLINLYNKGTQAKNIYRNHDVPKSTLYYWLDQYKVIKHSWSGKVCATAKDVYDLKRELSNVKQENEILKKLNCSLNSELKEKLIAISKLDGQYPVRAICRAAGIFHSTYYHYKLRRPTQTEIEKMDEILKPPIRDIFVMTKGRLGSKKIRILMINQGYSVSAKRIRRLLDEMNLVCRSRMKRAHYNYSKSSLPRVDHVKQQFNPPAPNMIWVSDITYIRVNYKAYYLCVVIDLHSRKVIGHRVEDNQDVELVRNTFLLAYNNRKPANDLIFHSDQGGQYTCYKFRKELLDRRIKPSYSRTGCPYDNAVAESFFRTFKEDEANHVYYKSLEDLIISVNEFIDFFNNVRPHNSLKNRTPNQVEENYLTSHKGTQTED